MASPIQQQPTQQFMQQQQQPGFLPTNTTPLYANTGYMSPISPQQTAGFGQSWMSPAPTAPQISGSSYGYLYGQAAQQQQPTYQPALQQVQNNPGYIPQFDPYASVNQGGPSTSSQSQQTIPSTSLGPGGVAHPRDYIRTHKAEIESWDTYAWKQFIGAFDAVKVRPRLLLCSDKLPTPSHRTLGREGRQR